MQLNMYQYFSLQRPQAHLDYLPYHNLNVQLKYQLNHPLVHLLLSRGFNFQWPTQCAVLLLSFKQIFLDEKQKLIPSFNTTSRINPLKFILIYLKFPFFPTLICHL